jgi:hypothetical protein
VRRLLLVFVLLGVLWTGAYYTYGYLTAATRIAALCAEVRPGMTILELRRFGIRHGLIGKTVDTGVIHLVESRTFGRYGCRIALKKGIVTESAYHRAD